MSHFLDRLNHFSHAEGALLGRPRRHHRRRPHLGRRLPQPLGARQDRAQHARRQLHRQLLLEDLRQGRHRHLGDAADRLPAHALGHAQPRAARLRARCQLQLVPVQRQPRQAPDGARPAAQALARGAAAARPGGSLGLDPVSDEAKRRDYQKVRGLGGFVRSSWDEVNEIIAAANVYTVKKYGPDRVIGFSPIPAMSMVSYAAGSRYLSLIGGVCMSFYDWYCDLPPASPQIWGEQTDVPESADWYNSTYIIAWGSNVPQTRTPDAHFFTEVRYKGAKTVAVTPDYSEVAKLADIWMHPKQGTDAAVAMAMGHVVLKEFYLRHAQRVLRRLRAPLHRPADAGDAEGAQAARRQHHARARPLRARQRLQRQARPGQQPGVEDAGLRRRRQGGAAAMVRSASAGAPKAAPTRASGTSRTRKRVTTATSS